MSEIITAAFPDLNDLTIRAENYLVDQYEMVQPKSQLIFDVKDITTAYDKVSSLGGYDELTEIGESESWPIADIVEGYDKTLTPVTYSKKIGISRQQRQDDPKGALDSFEVKVKFHSQAAIQTYEKLAAAIFNGAFSSITSPDSQYLIDSDHPQSPSVTGTTYSNVIDNKLTGDGSALKAAFVQASDNLFNMAGQPIVITNWLLVVPPALKDAGLREVKSVYGQANVVSPTTVQTGDLMGEVQVIDWTYLSEKLGGSDDRWFLVANPAQYSGMHSLRFVWRERPTFNADGVQPYINYDNGTYWFPIIMRCKVGCIDWRHLIGSTASK